MKHMQKMTANFFSKVRLLRGSATKQSGCAGMRMSALPRFASSCIQYPPQLGKPCRSGDGLQAGSGDPETAKFDVRGFPDEILGNRAILLDVPDPEATAWISQKREQGGLWEASSPCRRAGISSCRTVTTHSTIRVLTMVGMETA